MPLVGMALAAECSQADAAKETGIGQRAPYGQMEHQGLTCTVQWEGSCMHPGMDHVVCVVHMGARWGPAPLAPVHSVSGCCPVHSGIPYAVTGFDTDDTCRTRQ